MFASGEVARLLADWIKCKLGVAVVRQGLLRPFLPAFSAARVRQGAEEDLLRPRRGKGGRQFQENAVRCDVELEARAGAPVPPFRIALGRITYPLVETVVRNFSGSAIWGLMIPERSRSLKPGYRQPSSGSSSDAAGRRRPARPVRPCRTCRCRYRASCRCRPSRRGAWRRARCRSAWRP